MERGTDKNGQSERKTEQKRIRGGADFFLLNVHELMEAPFLRHFLENIFSELT